MFESGQGSENEQLNRLLSDDVVRLVVALSGGADSVALLHWLVNAQTGKSIVAIHVNHGLQKESLRWQKFCEELCELLDVELKCVLVEVDSKGSIEENARRARYVAFEKFLKSGDLLLLAHHADDQVETVLLNLFRGSEAFGVRGMPGERAIGDAKLYRPLLDLSRKDILNYCQKNKLSWVEDDTNLDIGMDRNFLRHELLPKIAKRFPSAARALRGAHERDTLASQLIENIAKKDLDSALAEDGGISLHVIRGLGELRIVNMLREFLRRKKIQFPSGNLLRECVNVMLNSAKDADPLLAWATYELRRHDNFIYLLNSMPEIDLSSVLKFNCRKPFEISGCLLSAEQVKGRGVVLDIEINLEGRFRQGGEKIQQKHLRTLKKMFQENGVPSWLRYRIPLIFEGDQLIVVPGIPAWNIDPIEAKDRQAGSDENGWVFTFETWDRVQ
ncbi:MAG: tRNA lysidine(34) synthetase TilS [Gammaproteobacteria bacterium]|nr:tRNA lysidine(34) synthetase TilS [Gammaproteobacteria bacterium]